jgi:DNA-binding winged helix-turn-helix (wHTH) protein
MYIALCFKEYPPFQREKRAKLHHQREQRGEIVVTPANTHPIWRFGVFEVDPRREELRRAGTPVKMREQSFRILIYLLEHAGETVTRDELRKVLWPSDTFVDFDHSLNTAVMKLRDALGDSTDAPLYIETIPKRGYRFIAPVSQATESRNRAAGSEGGAAAAATSETSGSEEVVPASAEIPVSPRRPGRKAAGIGLKLGLILGLILTVAAGSVLFLRKRPFPAPLQNGSKDSSAFQTVPLTSAPGNPILPAFSPDGREIAYVWDGTERRRYDVYVQLVGADMPLRLTYSKSGLVGAPSWAPDGSEIAFSRCD